MTADVSAFEARDLDCGYQGRPIVSRVSFAIKRGEFVAMVGANGAGKSTIIRSVYGIVPLIKGSIFVHGRQTEPVPEVLRRSGVSCLPQGRRVFDGISVRQHLTLASMVTAPQRPEAQAALTEARSRLAAFMDKPANLLSGGQQQLVGLAMALESNPAVLLLDEPVAGLATDLRTEVYAMLATLAREGELGVLTVEHDTRTAFRFVDRVLEIADGRLAPSRR